jgi:hypothetical protein
MEIVSALSHLGIEERDAHAADEPSCVPAGLWVFAMFKSNDNFSKRVLEKRMIPNDNLVSGRHDFTNGGETPQTEQLPIRSWEKDSDSFTGRKVVSFNRMDSASPRRFII